MDENTWKFAQIIMWIIGLQTTFLTFIIGFFWTSLNAKFTKIDQRFDKLDEKLSGQIKSLDEKVTDIDRRLCRLEGAFSSKDCCMIKDDRQMKKAE